MSCGVSSLRSDFNQRGYSLVELTITIVVASVVFISVGTLIIQTQKGIKINQQRQHMIDNLMSSNMAILRYMGQAAGMRWVGNNNLNAAAALVTGGSCFSGNTCGRVRQLNQAPNSNATTVAIQPTPPVTTLAIFLKEASRSGHTAVANKLTDFNGVGVFYQHQTSAWSGVLWISEVQGPGANLAVRAGNAGAGAGSISFENVVNIAVINPDPPDVTVNTGPLRGVDIQITMRVFNTPERDLWRFCRPDEMGANANCPTLAPYSEMDRTVHVTFRNTVLGPPSHLATPPADRRFFERVYGGLYFFDFNFPNISRANSSEGF